MYLLVFNSINIHDFVVKDKFLLLIYFLCFYEKVLLYNIYKNKFLVCGYLLENKTLIIKKEAFTNLKNDSKLNFKYAFVLLILH